MRLASIGILVFCCVWVVSASLTGAIFTTNSTGAVVNGNIYDLREDVYLNGGPQNLNSAGLPDGYYFFQVTDPSGSVLLSSDDAVCRQLRVAGGVVAGAGYDSFVSGCLHLPNGAFNPANGSTPVRLSPFDFTPNAGGEYKVWLIAQTSSTTIDPTDSKRLEFSPSDSKTDNFKVRATAGCPNPNDCGQTLSPLISGVKFYDANTNGSQDAGEPGIPNWQIVLFGAASNSTTTAQVPAGSYSFVSLAAGTYGVCEVLPSNTTPTWVPTTPTSITNLTVPPDRTGNNFGNVCLGTGGGLTLGFWSNKNGAALFGADDLAAMVALNLVNANGTIFDPASYTAFRTWLLNANATNMAYMLSAQLAAMKLNVLNGKVDGPTQVYAGAAPAGCTVAGLSTTGFITINDLISAANGSLFTNPNTTASGAARTCQQFMKNALDNANNNRNFVQATACEVNYSGLELSCAP
jgi:hypothetical protein